MSKFLRTAAVIGVAVSVMGCAIHPLPDDVTGLSTYKIVQKIRCEARDGLRTNLAQWLIRRKSNEDPTGFTYQLGQTLLEHEDAIETFYTPAVQARLPPAIQKKVMMFENAAIAFDFTFNITEMNNLDPTLNLTRILKNKTFTADTSANFDRTRENTRTFTIADKFKTLTQIRQKKCDGITFETENYVYPIAGRIGVDKMVRTFVGLVLNEDLSTPSSPGGDSDGDGSQSTKPPPSLTDNLMFTTTLKAGGTPELTVMPLGTALQITSESLGVTASRTDVHSVIISLALPQSNSGNTKSNSASCVPTTGPRAIFINVANQPNKCSAEATALHAIDLFILRFQINNVSVAVQAAAQ
jgi:hypothetical protein